MRNHAALKTQQNSATQARGPRRAVKAAALATLTVVAVAVPAATASATNGGGWQPIPAGSGDATCGSTVVHISLPTPNAYQRVLPQPDGTVLIETKGVSTLTFTTDAGASVSVHQAGQSKVIVNPETGDAESTSEGAGAWIFSPQQATQFGAPSEIFYSAGLMEFHVNGADQSITPVKVPQHLVDICAELGAH